MWRVLSLPSNSPATLAAQTAAITRKPLLSQYRRHSRLQLQYRQHQPPQRLRQLRPPLRQNHNRYRQNRNQHHNRRSQNQRQFCLNHNRYRQNRNQHHNRQSQSQRQFRLSHNRYRQSRNQLHNRQSQSQSQPQFRLNQNQARLRSPLTRRSSAQRNSMPAGGWPPSRPNTLTRAAPQAQASPLLWSIPEWMLITLTCVTTLPLAEM